MSQTQFSSKRINLFIILISSLMMLAVLNLPFKAKPFGDITFHEEAKNLALFIKGKMPYESVTISKAPGPVLFYLPPYFIAPSDATDNELWVYGVSFTSILITISLILIFRSGTAFFSKEVGLLSIILFFIFPIHCYYSLGIMAEAPAFFSLSVAVYGWSMAFKDPQQKRGWITMTIGLLLLILNRPNAMLLLGLGITIVLYAFFKNKHFFKLYGKKMLVSLTIVGFAGFGILQLAKAITVSKTGMNQDVLLYYVAHQGRFQFREEPTNFTFWDNDFRSGTKDYQNWLNSEGELEATIDKTKRTYAEVYREFLINDALEHPFWFTRQFFVKCFYGHIYFINSVKPEKFHLGPFNGSIGYNIFILLINLINIIIIAGAIIFLFKERNLIHYWLFWGVIVSLLVFHGLTYMEPRYIFPSKVVLYIMSAAGLYRIAIVQQIVGKISVYLFPKHHPA